MTEIFHSKEYILGLGARLGGANLKFQGINEGSQTNNDRADLYEFARKVRPTHSTADPDNRAELAIALDYLSSVYLSADSKQRSEIRDELAQERDALRWLDYYIHVATIGLQSTGNPKWLERALAAISMLDQRIDFRQTYLALGTLYVLAAESGLEPQPYFRAIAGISNTKVNRGLAVVATQQVLADFHNSPFFEESVRRKLTDKV